MWKGKFASRFGACLPVKVDLPSSSSSAAAAAAAGRSIEQPIGCCQYNGWLQAVLYSVCVCYDEETVAGDEVVTSHSNALLRW